VLGGSLPPSLGHHERLKADTRTSFVTRVGALWVPQLQPCGLASQMSSGHAVGWNDAMKDQVIGR
jgi:hypothetical protein